MENNTVQIAWDSHTEHFVLLVNGLEYSECDPLYSAYLLQHMYNQCSAIREQMYALQQALALAEEDMNKIRVNPEFASQYLNTLTETVKEAVKEQKVNE